MTLLRVAGPAPGAGHATVREKYRGILKLGVPRPLPELVPSERSPHRILVVEDDPTLASALRRYLKRKHAAVEVATSLADAREPLESGSFDIVLSDVSLPDGHCFTLLDHAAELAQPPGIVVMTADESIEHPISAMHSGAADFLIKPFSFDHLDQALARAAEVVRRLRGVHDVPMHRPQTPEEGPVTQVHETGALASASNPSWREKVAPSLVGQDDAIIDALDMIRSTADTDTTVLVTGASGTGKELIARAVHQASERAEGPYVVLNCAAIPENLLESELFGHVRGAFTGATNNRQGRFVEADGGTLFLDEVGELPLALQAKLLRALQEKEVSAVGGGKTQKVDVRIVAATNRDLEQAVEKGEFREDLYYRLDVIPIELPALSERKGDIPRLIDAFIADLNFSRKRHITGVSDEAMAILTSYEWPGNVRQLRNVVERMVVLRGEGILDERDIPRKIRKATGTDAPAQTAGELPEEGIDLRDAVETFENQLILQALERTGWNKNQAATILKMNRTTLVEKLKKKNLKQA